MAQISVKTIPVISNIKGLAKEIKFMLPEIDIKCIEPGQSEPLLSNAEIVVADCDLLTSYIPVLNNTKWVQATWAGVDKLVLSLNENEQLPFTLTRFSGPHFGKLMSEYVISAIVNQERHFYELKNLQTEKKWSNDETVRNYRSISDLKIGILGVGAIGTYVAEKLKSFGATIFGFGRSPKESKIINSSISSYFDSRDLPTLLEISDYVINILPATKETKGLLNGSILQHCSKKHTVFINIGRGNIIKESDLIEALNKNWLSAAVLDVFETEPLPNESPLWSMKNVIITPHLAAVSRPKDIAEQFVVNFKKYQNGESLSHTFDIRKQY